MLGSGAALDTTDTIFRTVPLCCPHLNQVPHAGGHTAEMLELVGHLDRAKYTPRTYVVASTDKMGTQKALTAEKAQHPSSSVSGHSLGCMHA